MNTKCEAEKTTTVLYDGKTLVNILTDKRQVRLFNDYMKALERMGIEDYELPDAAAVIIENGFIKEQKADNLIKLEKSRMSNEEKLDMIRGFIHARLSENIRSIYPINEQLYDCAVDERIEKLSKSFFEIEGGSDDKAELIEYVESVLRCYEKYKFSMNEYIKSFYVRNLIKISKTVMDNSYGNISIIDDREILEAVCDCFCDSVRRGSEDASKVGRIELPWNEHTDIYDWGNFGYMCFFGCSSHIRDLKIGNIISAKCVKTDDVDDDNEYDDNECDETKRFPGLFSAFITNCRHGFTYQIISRPARYDSVEEMLAVVTEKPVFGTFSSDKIIEPIRSYDCEPADIGNTDIYVVSVKRASFENET